MIFRVANPRRQNHRVLRDFVVGNLFEQMRDAVQPRLLLVDGLDHMPRRFGDVGTLQHRFLGLGVLLPAAARFQIHRAELPLLQRIVDPHREAQMLLFVGDREPVLDQDDAGTHQHALEFRHRAEEFLDLVFGAEAHHPLDAGAVVPAAVEQHDLAAGRQMRNVALEIPLRALALVRRRKGRDAADPRIEPLGDALDDAALAGGIAAFENHHHLELLLLHPALQFHQLALQAEQLLEIDAPVDGLLRGMVGEFVGQRVEAIVVDLEFQLLVETVEHFRMNAIVDRRGPLAVLVMAAPVGRVGVNANDRRYRRYRGPPRGKQKAGV